MEAQPQQVTFTISYREVHIVIWFIIDVLLEYCL